MGWKTSLKSLVADAARSGQRHQRQGEATPRRSGWPARKRGKRVSLHGADVRRQARRIVARARAVGTGDQDREAAYACRRCRLTRSLFQMRLDPVAEGSSTYTRSRPSTGPSSTTRARRRAGRPRARAGRAPAEPDAPCARAGSPPPTPRWILTARARTRPRRAQPAPLASPSRAGRGGRSRSAGRRPRAPAASRAGRDRWR